MEGAFDGGLKRWTFFTHDETVVWCFIQVHLVNDNGDKRSVSLIYAAYILCMCLCAQLDGIDCVTDWPYTKYNTLYLKTKYFFIKCRYIQCWQWALIRTSKIKSYSSTVPLEYFAASQTVVSYHESNFLPISIREIYWFASPSSCSSICFFVSPSIYSCSSLHIAFLY